MRRVIVEVAAAVQSTQAAVPHLRLNGFEIPPLLVERRVEDRLTVLAGAENVVGHQHMEMDVAVEVAAKPGHERHGAEV